MLSRVSIQSKLLVMLLLTSILSAAVVGVHRISVGPQLTARLGVRPVDRDPTVADSAVADSMSPISRTPWWSIRADRRPRRPSRRSRRASTSSERTIDPVQQQSIVDYYNEAVRQGRGRADRQGRRRRRTAADVERAAIPAGPLHRTVRRLERGDQDRRRPRRQRVVGGQCAVQRLLPRDRHAVRVRGRPAARHPGQRRLLRLQGRGPRYQHSQRPLQAARLTDAYMKALDSNDGRLRRRHRLRRLPARRRAHRLVGVPGRPGQAASDGVLALQFPISKINRLMTMDRRWEESGMGKTGETFIVGPDDLMRSDSRLFLEDPEGVQTRRRRGGHTTRRRRRTRSGSTAPPWCSRSRPKRPSWPSRDSGAP